MRIIGLMAALLLAMSSLSLAQTLSSKVDSLSYGLGVMMGQSFQKEGIKTLNEEAMVQGIKDVFSDAKLAIDEASATALYRAAIKEGQEMKNQDAILAGQAYLAENGRKAGVTTTASGLQYEVLKSGSGAKPSATDKVMTHYHGTLTDGTVFDSSVDRGEPITFPVNGVIKGWQEALQLMSVGDKWKLTVPYDLAYGPRGAGGSIPPYATLIFEVELLQIN